jgi:hypothetical protein
MDLLDRFPDEKAKDLKKQNIRLQAIGQLDRLPAKNPQAAGQDHRPAPPDHTAMTLVLALSYGGREEIVAAARSLAGCRRGKLEPGADRLHAFRIPPANRRHPGPRPAHPHLRRNARLEFPALADQLCGNRHRQKILARFPPQRPRVRARIPAPPSRPC